MTHNIKILNTFAEAVFNGIKTFEVRENDRGYQKGDLVYFTVIEKDGIEITNHPLSNRCYKITYVLNYTNDCHLLMKIMKNY